MGPDLGFGIEAQRSNRSRPALTSSPPVLLRGVTLWLAESIVTFGLVEFEDLNIESEVAKGSYGIVYAAQWRGYGSRAISCLLHLLLAAHLDTDRCLVVQKLPRAVQRCSIHSRMRLLASVQCTAQRRRRYQVAVKMLDDKDVLFDSNNVEHADQAIQSDALVQEIRVFQELHHDNIVTFIG